MIRRISYNWETEKLYLGFDEDGFIYAKHLPALDTFIRITEVAFAPEQVFDFLSVRSEERFNIIGLWDGSTSLLAVLIKFYLNRVTASFRDTLSTFRHFDKSSRNLSCAPRFNSANMWFTIELETMKQEHGRSRINGLTR
jgi:hypothetical protein